jgi:hypothetical protein
VLAVTPVLRLASLLVVPIVIASASDPRASGGVPPVVAPSGQGQELDAATLDELDARPKEPVVATAGEDVPLDQGTREPTIAVNPTDLSNIAAASLFTLRLSTDGGLSFSAPIAAVVPAGYTPAGDPSLAFDSVGRLFWTYLGSRIDNRLLDVFILQLDPMTGVIVSGPVNVSAEAGFPASPGLNNNDKPWLAVDRFGGSGFRDRIYVVWTNFTPTGTRVHATFSLDRGQSWSSPALTLSGAGEGFVWPSHTAVAPDGDVYVAYHSQPGFSLDGAPDGTSGQVFVLRSSDGGVSYPQKTVAYGPGEADLTFNAQTTGTGRRLFRSISWTQGSVQAWVLPDPIDPNGVYVVAADDPTNTTQGGGGDDADIFIVRSLDQGVTWSPPSRIDTSPVGTIQFFPTAAIDDETGCLAVTWYDTRAGATNADGNFLLDLFIATSEDGGLTFFPEFALNDAPFDPDLMAPLAPPTRPDDTLRIGEYNGVAVAGGLARAVWTGNDGAPLFDQRTFFDSTVACGVADVRIDIKPDSDRNGLNPRNNGVIPVAILGSPTFNVADVDRATLTFGPDGVATPDHEALGHLENVNGDQFVDLVSHYRTQLTGIEPGDVEACVTGQLLDGTTFQDCDVIKTGGNPTPQDLDGDSFADVADNCIGLYNPDQADSNRDGHGNACDADYDDNEVVGGSDYLILARTWGKRLGDPGYNEHVDCNEDGVIGAAEYLLFARSMGEAPGPSGTACPGECD